MIGQFGLQALARHVLHHHPGVAGIVLADVVEAQQIGMLEVEALPHAAEFGIEIAADELQGDFLAGVAGGVVDFAEAAAAHAALDRYSRPAAGCRWHTGTDHRPAAPACRRAGDGMIGCIAQSVLHGNPCEDMIFQLPMRWADLLF